MVSEHTPGPWREHRQWVVAGTKTICHIGEITYDNDAPWTVEDDANLALILAAPDLLAACKAALQPLLDADHPWHELRDNLSAAIAKAEGKAE